MLTRGTSLLINQVLQTSFLNDATSPPAGTILKYGIAHAQDGTVYICNLPTTQRTFQRGKFLCRQDGALIVSTSGTAVGHEGPFNLTNSRELLVSTGTPVTSRDAFGFDASGNLCVSATA